MKIDTLASSADPKHVSLTVRGILLAFVPLLLAQGHHVGLEGVTEARLFELIEAITAALAAIMVAYGASRKVLYKLK